MTKEQYILRSYSGGGEEYFDTINGIRKIVYNTGDIIWQKNEVVIGIRPYGYQGRIIKYIDEEQFKIDTLRINSLSLPKLTQETKSYLQKYEVIENLIINEKFYNHKMSLFLKHAGVILESINKEMILRFFGIETKKGKI